MLCEESSKLNPLLKVLLEGYYDEDCVMSKLRGCPHLLQDVWRKVAKFNRSQIILPDKDVKFDYRTNWRDWGTTYPSVDSLESALFVAPISDDNHEFEDEDKRINFPKPSNININMMPFIVGESFKECRLPKYLLPYWKLIKLCIDHQFERSRYHEWNRDAYPSDVGKVYYLTIQESMVKAGESQRRPGLHVDSPGNIKIKNDLDLNQSLCKRGHGTSDAFKAHRWGAGCAHFKSYSCGDAIEYRKYLDNLLVTFGGIYIASSVADSCRVWNCGVRPEAIHKLGDVEYLRSSLPDESELLRPGQMYWITDRTPHESLPLKEDTIRQFFRIVTSDVSFWYKDHSTPNPLGVLPDPLITKIVVGNKFSDEGVEVVPCDQIEKMMSVYKTEQQNSELEDSDEDTENSELDDTEED